MCSYIMEVGVGWGTPISPVSKDILSQEGKKCLALTYRLAGTTLNKILFESALPCPRYPTLLSSVLQGEGRTSGCWDILRLFSGTRTKSLVPVCRLGQHQERRHF